jgi:hypothetical protein
VRVVNLNMVPLVDSPAMHVAGSIGMQPGIIRIGRGTRVDRIIPSLDPAVALEAHDDGLAVGHCLVQIELEIGEAGCGPRDVDPGVVEEILRCVVVVELDGIVLPAEIIELVRKEPGSSSQRRRIRKAHGAARRAARSAVMNGDPVSQGLNAADLHRVRRDDRGAGARRTARAGCGR